MGYGGAGTGLRSRAYHSARPSRRMTPVRGRRLLLTAVFVVVVVVTGSFLVRSSSPSSGPSGTVWPGLGVYMSGNNAGVDALTSSWAQQPNIGSFYLNWNSHVTPLMKAHGAQGRTLQVALSTRVNHRSY